jgi:preprotein translocase subunit Sec63
MDYKNLLYSILFGILTVGYYKIHKWWREGRDENPFFYKLDTNIGTFKDWVIIIVLAITSIVFFFKSL